MLKNRGDPIRILGSFALTNCLTLGQAKRHETNSDVDDDLQLSQVGKTVVKVERVFLCEIEKEECDARCSPIIHFFLGGFAGNAFRA